MVTAKGNSPRVAGIPPIILEEGEAKTVSSSPEIREHAANFENCKDNFVIFFNEK